GVPAGGGASVPPAAPRGRAAHHLCHHAHVQPPGAEGRADPAGQHPPAGGAAPLDPGGGRGDAQRAGEPLRGGRRAALHAPARPHAAPLQTARAAPRHRAAQRRPGLAAAAAPAPAGPSARRALLRRRRQHLQPGALPRGFAVSLQVILSHPKAVFKRRGSQPGMQESDFLKQITTVEELEPKANNCTKVLVWHTRTEKVNLANEPKYHLDTVNIEV
uniref:Galactosylgalactosylxylosylprotein 3-beta-glucuronosyltransferase n=1 Tax=Gallus gallus TaxID=9031 RepID=A0A8V0X684_CHICK